MTVIAIQSSPNLDGLTSSLAQAVLEGVEAEGGEAELVHLNIGEINLSVLIHCSRLLKPKLLKPIQKSFSTC